MKLFLSVIIFFSLSLCVRAQNKADSLEKLLAFAQDTQRVNILNDLYFEYEFENPQKALKYVTEAYSLANKISYKKGLAKSLYCYGYYYYYTNYAKALSYFFKALKIAEEIDDKDRISRSLISIGNIYSEQEKFQKALEYYLQSLKIDEHLNNKQNMVYTLNNIGGALMGLKRFDEAMEYYHKSLKVAREIKDKQNTAAALTNIGIAFSRLNKNNEALTYLLEALPIYKALQNQDGYIRNLLNIAKIYSEERKFSEAQKHLDKSLEVAEQMRTKSFMADVYNQIAGNFQRQKNYKAALEAHILFKEYTDSLLNERSSGQIAEMETKYQTEKKEKEIELLNKDKALKELEVKRQRMARNVLLGASLMLIGFAFWRVRVKQKTNKKLQEKNTLIEQQKNKLQETYSIIEEKNKDITDSINYAKRIQQAILPAREHILKAFPQSFIFYKPKDVVSGDFYAFAEKNGKYIIAACDCTGHGVPGAFMSMIGNDQINHIIQEKNITTPSEILTQLNKEIKRALKQNETGESKDGMDIALVSLKFRVSGLELKANEGHAELVSASVQEIPKSKIHEYLEKKTFMNKQVRNDGTSKLQTVNCELNFAGAHRPLWIVSSEDDASGKNFKLTEIKPDKTSIGGFTPDGQLFNNHSIELKKGDTFYIFTDGYADQFGGENQLTSKPGGKKLMTKNLKKLLLAIQNKSMDAQHKHIEETFNNWKGNFEQVDDVLVIGVRV